MWALTPLSKVGQLRQRKTPGLPTGGSSSSCRYPLGARYVPPSDEVSQLRHQSADDDARGGCRRHGRLSAKAPRPPLGADWGISPEAPPRYRRGGPGGKSAPAASKKRMYTRKAYATREALRRGQVANFQWVAAVTALGAIRSFFSGGRVRLGGCISVPHQP